MIFISDFLYYAFYHYLHFPSLPLFTPPILTFFTFSFFYHSLFFYHCLHHCFNFVYISLRFTIVYIFLLLPLFTPLVATLFTFHFLTIVYIYSLLLLFTFSLFYHWTHQKLCMNPITRIISKQLDIKLGLFTSRRTQLGS